MSINKNKISKDIFMGRKLMIQFFHQLLWFCNPVVTFVLFLTFVLFSRGSKTFCFDRIFKYKLPESSWLVSLGYSHYRRVKSPRFPPHLWLFDLCLLLPHPSVFIPRQRKKYSFFSWRSGMLLLKGWRSLGCRTILPPVLWNKLCCKHTAQAVLLPNTIVCVFPSAAKSIITSLQSD